MLWARAPLALGSGAPYATDRLRNKPLNAHREAFGNGAGCVNLT